MGHRHSRTPRAITLSNSHAITHCSVRFQRTPQRKLHTPRQLGTRGSSRLFSRILHPLRQHKKTYTPEWHRCNHRHHGYHNPPTPGNQLSVNISKYQVNTPCGNQLPDGRPCNSYYRYFASHRCNICGKQHPPPPEDKPRSFLAGKKPTGRRWSSKLHRYLKPGEMYP